MTGHKSRLEKKKRTRTKKISRHAINLRLETNYLVNERFERAKEGKRSKKKAKASRHKSDWQRSAKRNIAHVAAI